MKRSFDVIILGGGAAGLMCAVEAGKRGRRVAVLERAGRVGKKILISGGGRCNFINLHCRSENFLSSNPHFAKSVLARYTPADFIALVEKHGIAYHEKTLGQLFCDGSAQSVVTMLEEECRVAKVEIFVNVQICDVQITDVQINHVQTNHLQTNNGQTSDIRREVGFTVVAGEDQFTAPNLVVATGGLSIPKIGATAFGYELARKFGHSIRECRPGLVPLTFEATDHKNFCDLAGVSTEVMVRCGRQEFREKMLITHRGVSGPAILQISSYWQKPDPIVIDLAPGCEVTAELRPPTRPRTLAAARAALSQTLPNRLAERWLQMHPPAGWTNHALDQFERGLHRWEIMPAGTEGYEKAEITTGGVDTSELFPKTLESRKVSGLFFIGEVVDVTGQLGGFNFQWAWASGYCAGQAV